MKVHGIVADANKRCEFCCFVAELDAEEEMESASKRKKREEERKKREEKKKAELAKYFGAGAANKMRRGSAESQVGFI